MTVDDAIALFLNELDSAIKNICLADRFFFFEEVGGKGKQWYGNLSVIAGFVLRAEHDGLSVMFYK